MGCLSYPYQFFLWFLFLFYFAGDIGISVGAINVYGSIMLFRVHITMAAFQYSLQRTSGSASSASPFILSAYDRDVGPVKALTAITGTHPVNAMRATM